MSDDVGICVSCRPKAKQIARYWQLRLFVKPEADLFNPRFDI